MQHAVRTAWCLLSVWLLCGAAQAQVQPQAGQGDCRVAVDMGSSGLRAAAAGPGTADLQPWRELDLLKPLWASQSLDGALPQLITELHDMQAGAAWPAHCSRLGGGFAAWRLAWQLAPDRLPGLLQRVHAETGVAVLVMPQQVEGRYAFEAARRALGPRLTTAWVLDIGGGSLQVAGAEASFGADLGQKAWHRLLCEALQPGQACLLQSLSPQQAQLARSLVDEQLRELATMQGTGDRHMTAISRPVVRGIAPALARLEEGSQPQVAGPAVVGLSAVQRAIDTLAPLPVNELAARTGTPPAFAVYLLSDLLLTEGLLRATGTDRLYLAEAELNNLPGLLADERAVAWTQRYGCYLRRLGADGPSAYFSDPLTCPAP